MALSQVKEEPSTIPVKDEEPDASVNNQEWNEAKLEEAMSRLQDIYRQIRDLRSTIPNLFEPLTTLQSSPQMLHNALSQSIVNANENLRKFKQLMDDEFSQQVMEHAKASRAQNPKGIKPYKLVEHPEWYQT